MVYEKTTNQPPHTQMGAGNTKSSSSTSKSKKRPRPKKYKNKKINKHKIGDLHLDHYQIDDGDDHTVTTSFPCKIAIIGAARSGKTSIFHRFLKNKFHIKTAHDTAANVGLRMVEYEHCLPIWFEVWDLPTHVPTHGGPNQNDAHHYGSEHEAYQEESKQRKRMNAWEAHEQPAYNEELKRSHTDPATGLVSLIKKDHDAVFMVVEASTFSSYDLDETIDALLTDVDFLNDHTKYEILRVLVVSKIDELSENELENLLIQVSSIAEDKGLDFVTTSSRIGTRSIRELFKFAAQRTVMNVQAIERDLKNKINVAATFEDDEQQPKAQIHTNIHDRHKMDNLFTTTSHY